MTKADVWGGEGGEGVGGGTGERMTVKIIPKLSCPMGKERWEEGKRAVAFYVK